MTPLEYAGLCAGILLLILSALTCLERRPPRRQARECRLPISRKALRDLERRLEGEVRE